MISLNFLDLFSGIGGFRVGLEKAGHTCVGYVEKDKFARKSYEAIHNVEGEWTRNDITTVTNEEWRELSGKVDLICSGNPCQSFSIGGFYQGFRDSRGSLFFELFRAIEQIKPRFLLFENVEGLLHNDKGHSFRTVLNKLDEIGYDAEWSMCNSENFGFPQSRKRIFVVGYIRGSFKQRVFPIERIRGHMESPGFEQSSTYADLHVRPIVTPKWINKTMNGRRFKEIGESSFTLTVKDRHGIIIHDDDYDYFKVRLLTPLESWRLQNFTDEMYEKASEVNSKNQLYKQASNAVTTNIVYEIARKLGEIYGE